MPTIEVLRSDSTYKLQRAYVTSNLLHFLIYFQLRSYYVAAAMNSNGIVNAAAIGKMLSELVTFDSCSWDFSSIDIKRFTPGQNNKLYLQDRVKEVLGYHYKIPYPKEDLSSARCVKCSTLHGMLDHLGAKWSHICGWEKANWFARNQKGSFLLGKPLFVTFRESKALIFIFLFHRIL